MNDAPPKQPTRFLWWPILACLLFVFAIPASCYFLALHDVRKNFHIPSSGQSYFSVELVHLQPSLHHGLWFEFRVIPLDHHLISTAYWRLYPWRTLEVY